MVEGRVWACGSCGSTGLTTVLDLGMQPMPQAKPGQDEVQRYPLRLVRCPLCTLVQLDYIVPQKELFPADYPYATGNTAALRDHFAKLAVLIGTLVKRDDLVIDIGGNDGTMLAELQKIAPDNRLLLVEPTLQYKKATVPVWSDYFTADTADGIQAMHGEAKVVVTSNTFGHVPDPHDFLDGVDILLAEDGILIIENQDFLNVVNLLQIDTVYHEHLRYYTPASLSRLLEQHGFIITSLTRLEMHGGSFRAVAVRQQNGLQARAEGLASRLAEMVELAAQEGPVYAIGAPTRATPLVNFAGLGRYLACACEITGSEKIGAVIPGTAIPVVDEKALFEAQPPYALLLAWDLAGTLIPKLRERGYKGTFILPLPEPVIVDD